MIVDYFQNIEFGRPFILWLLGIIPFLIYFYYLRQRNSPAIPISNIEAKGLSSWKVAGRHIPFILRLLSIAAVIIALAKPQSRNIEQNTEGEGIDIVLAIDVSGSMTAQDLQPNRLEAAKTVAADFVNRRPTDRIGIVIFSGESFTQVPLTSDHEMVLSAIQNIHFGLLEDGTAIGSGLSTSVDRLRTSKAKSKVIVLLTDGENNGGLIDPNTAKEIAKTFGIKVYTIGVGTDGFAPTPRQSPIGGVVMEQQKVSIDEGLLKQIAGETGGKYFRARDNNSLNEIYTTIDNLEKTKMEVKRNIRFQDKFLPFVIFALLCLLFEAIFTYLIIKKFP